MKRRGAGIRVGETRAQLGGSWVKAVVVYESTDGNTHFVTDAIASGLGVGGFAQDNHCAGQALVVRSQTHHRAHVAPTAVVVRWCWPWWKSSTVWWPACFDGFESRVRVCDGFVVGHGGPVVEQLGDSV